MIELGIERERPDGEQNERNIRVHQISEDALLERHAKGHDRLAGEFQGHRLPVEAFKTLAFHLVKKIVVAGGYVVDQALGQRLLFGERFGFEHRTLRDLDIAPSFGSDRTHQSRRIVLNLALHLVVKLGRQRSNQHRMRRTRVGSRSHGCDVGRFENENSSRTRAAATGCNVDNYRNLRGSDLLEDLPRGIDQPSWRIDLDQYRLITAPLCFVDGPRDIFLRDGLNRVIDDDLENLSGRDRAENANRDEAEKNAEK